ncbi:MAG: hypothetical protein K6E15_02955 [Prevotella sp.]|nr:hypothetical protein [Prevotella sp.]
MGTGRTLQQHDANGSGNDFYDLCGRVLDITVTLKNTDDKITYKGIVIKNGQKKSEKHLAISGIICNFASKKWTYQ